MSLTDLAPDEDFESFPSEKRQRSQLVTFQRNKTYAVIITRDEPTERTIFYMVKSKSGRPLVTFRLPLPWVYYTMWGTLNSGDGSHNKDYYWSPAYVGFASKELTSLDEVMTLPHLPNMVSFTPCQAMENQPVGDGAGMAAGLADFFWSGAFNCDYEIQRSRSVSYEAIMAEAMKILDGDLYERMAERFPDLGKWTIETSVYKCERKVLAFLLAWEEMGAGVVLKQDGTESVDAVTKPLCSVITERLGLPKKASTDEF